MMENVIEVTSLSKIYSSGQKNNLGKIKPALQNINFSLKKGESLGVIGKNGSGKTTLLSMLAGLKKPTEGEIKIKGHLNSIIHIGSGFHPDLSGIDNIKLILKLANTPKRNLKIIIDEIIDFSELASDLNKPVKHYSSGMYLRLAFSVFSHVESDILLIDEVLSVGDSSFSQKSFNKILSLQKKGVSFIIASHDIERLELLCNKGLYLNSGKQQRLDSYQEVLQDYSIQLHKENLPKNPDVLFEDDSIKVKKVEAKGFSKEIDNVFIFSNNKEIVIEIYFEVKKKIINFDFGIDVSAYLTSFLFSSPLTQNFNGLNLEPGSFKRVCKIPANYFYKGFFEVSIWGGNTASDKFILKSCISLKVNASPNFTKKSLAHINHTFLPEFKWNFEAL